MENELQGVASLVTQRLAGVGQYFGMASLGICRREGNVLSRTSSWAASGSCGLGWLDSGSGKSWLEAEILAGREVWVEDSSSVQVPEAVRRQIAGQGGPRSLVALPVTEEGAVRGMVVGGYHGMCQSWSVPLRRSIRLVFGLLSGACERCLATERYEESQDEMYSILSSIEDPIGTFDLEGRVLTCNETFLRVLGLKKRSARAGHGHAKLADLQPHPRLAELVDDFRKGRVPAEMPYRDNHYRRRVYALNLFPIAVRGRLTAIACHGHDVSRERLLDERLARADQEAMVTRSAAGCLHDLNNLLQVAVDLCDYHVKEPGGSSDGERLAELMDIVHRAADLGVRSFAYLRKALIGRIILNVNSELGRIEDMLQACLSDQVGLSLCLGEGAGSVELAVGDFEKIIRLICRYVRDRAPDAAGLVLATMCVGPEQVDHPLSHTFHPRYVQIEVSARDSCADGNDASHWGPVDWAWHEHDRLDSVRKIAAVADGAIDVSDSGGVRLYLPQHDDSAATS